MACKGRKRKKYSYDVRDPYDRVQVLDLPFSQLNRRGRKAKRKKMMEVL